MCRSRKYQSIPSPGEPPPPGEGVLQGEGVLKSEPNWDLQRNMGEFKPKINHLVKVMDIFTTWFILMGNGSLTGNSSVEKQSQDKEGWRVFFRTYAPHGQGVKGFESSNVRVRDIFWSISVQKI